MFFSVLCACAGMLHPGEVGPSEELLRLKDIVETLESKSQEAISEVEEWKARFQAMRQAKVNLDSELAQSVEACKRLEKQLQGMVPARSLVLNCWLSASPNAS
jgi:DNA repair exonuclease SbcCD ATPase subunit